MSRSEWCQEEVTIAIFYASRQIYYATIELLLQDRGYQRGSVAIMQKLNRITKQNPHLKGSRLEWNRQAVDEWLISAMDQLSREEVLSLTGLGERERKIVHTVGRGYTTPVVYQLSPWGRTRFCTAYGAHSAHSILILTTTTRRLHRATTSREKNRDDGCSSCVRRYIVI